MKKIISIALSLVFVASTAAPALAQYEARGTVKKNVSATSTQQTHATAIKKADTDYKAAIKKAEADYKAVVDAAKAVLKKAKADALAKMQAAKQTAGEALRIETKNKKATLKVEQNIALGKFLVAANGMTLYLKKDDSPGKSTCSGACVLSWPPLTTTGKLVAGEGVSGKVDTIKRADGKKQVTYNGMPLYFWTGDKKAGDTTGNGFKGIWSVVAP